MELHKSERIKKISEQYLDARIEKIVEVLQTEPFKAKDEENPIRNFWNLEPLS